MIGVGTMSNDLNTVMSSFNAEGTPVHGVPTDSYTEEALWL